MEIIGKISKGSKMDQVYIPKNRPGLAAGDHVIVKTLEENKPISKLYFYGVKNIEPIKLDIIKEIIRIAEKNLRSYDNLIITGSFLEEGFQFNDIDIIILAEKEININHIKEEAEKKTGIKADILSLSNKAFIQGLENDPLYQMMLSKCIAKNRFIYKVKHKINYKILDLHLLKSKTLIDNFDFLSGNEKYGFIRNMFAIWLYMKGRKLTKEIVDNEIKTALNLKNIIVLKQNMVNKNIFLKKYKLIYDKALANILKGIESGAK